MRGIAPASVGLLAGVMAATAPMAQGTTPQVAAHLFVERVTTDLNGRPRRTLAGAQRAAPGERVVVVLHWRNDSPAPVRSVTLSRAELRGATPDLNDPMLQVSIDGGQRWSRFDQLWLPTPLGGVRRALGQEVTHVRWLLPDPVSPGQAGKVSYRAIAR